MELARRKFVILLAGPFLVPSGRSINKAFRSLLFYSYIARKARLHLKSRVHSLHAALYAISKRGGRILVGAAYDKERDAWSAFDRRTIVAGTAPNGRAAGVLMRILHSRILQGE